MKHVESAKREQARAIEEALQKINTLQETKSSLENERTRLTTILKETENNMSKTVQELNATKNTLQKTQMDFAQKDEGGKELQNKLAAETESKERSHQELSQIKKQVCHLLTLPNSLSHDIKIIACVFKLADLEENLCETRAELGRARCQSNQDEHRFHNREQELLARIEEARGREKRLEDQKHNLEVCLADATQQIQELKARLGGAEGRIRALDEQLACVELHKRDTEHKLSSVAHTLRRIAGIQPDGSVNLTYRLISPTRRYSPIRNGISSSSCHDYDARSTSQCPEASCDLDPDLVRKGVRNLMHQVAQIEREKDDMKVQLAAAKKQLQDAAEQQLRCDGKVGKLQQMLRHLQEEKSNLNTECSMKASALNSLEEKFKQKCDECQQMREKITQLEMQLGSCNEENSQIEVKYTILYCFYVSFRTVWLLLNRNGIFKVEGKSYYNRLSKSLKFKLLLGSYKSL